MTLSCYLVEEKCNKFVDISFFKKLLFMQNNHLKKKNLIDQLEFQELEMETSFSFRYP